MRITRGESTLESYREDKNTTVTRAVSCLLHFHVVGPLPKDYHTEELSGAVESLVAKVIDIVSKSKALGTLEFYRETTISFVFGLPTEGATDIADACELAFLVREGLVSLNKQRAIFSLPPIAVCTVVREGKVEYGPRSWSRGSLSYEWLTPTSEELLPVAMHYGIGGVLVPHDILPKVGHQCVSREVDNVFLSSSAVHLNIYEVLARCREEAPANLLRYMSHYKTGLEAYRARRWMTSIECFHELFSKTSDRAAQAMISHARHWVKRDLGSYWDTSWELFGDDWDEVV